MELYILKDNVQHNIKEYKEIEKPYKIYFSSKEKYVVIDVSIEDEVKYIKRQIGAFNSKFHMLFLCFGTTKETYWYNEVYHILLTDEKQIDDYIKKGLNDYLTGGKLCQQQ